MAPPDGSRDRAPLTPPPQDYRPARDYDGGDRSMRNLALAAAGLALVVMGGVWALSGHHHAATIPVIEPDPAPLRIKPANPGGLQVAGAEDAMLNAAPGGQNEADKLAPPPEAPAPQALRQQARAAEHAADGLADQAGGKTETPPPAPAAAIPAPTAAISARPAAPAAISAPAAVREAPAPDAAPDVARPARDAGVQVQLAALDSEAASRAAWDRLARQLPALFDGRRPAVTEATVNGKQYWRLRTGGFADIAAATAFCVQLRDHGAACTIARF